MSAAPPRPGLDALGASFGEVAGAEVVRHFGDGAAEYRAVRETVGIASRTDLAVIRLHGRDPVKMLQGLITNDLAGAPADRGVYAALLTPKGRTIAELRAFRRPAEGGVEVLALLPREALEGTRSHLKKFVPPMFARWEELDAEAGVLGVYGPRSRQLLERVLRAPVPELPEEGLLLPDSDGVLAAVRTLDAGGEDGYDLVVRAEGLSRIWESLLSEGAELGARPVGFGALETLRIEAGRPRYGHELTEETIPTEAFEAPGLMPRAISFSKGCYTGQEVVVRIAHRGRVNRHLRGLLLGDAPVPHPRTPLFREGSEREVGWTTSAAHSPLLGQTVALGFVRREVEPGDAVRTAGVDGPQARVAALPFSPDEAP